jgi:hypothetical protein
MIFSRRWLNCIAVVFACIASFSVSARADGPPVLAAQRPNLLGSYVFQPLPSGVFTWGSTDALPGLGQTAPSSDVATVNMVLASQAPYASAVTNVVAGNLVINIPTSISGSAAGFTQFRYGGTPTLAIGGLFGNLTIPAIWNAGLTASATNYAMIVQTTATQINAPSGGLVNLNINNTAVVGVSAASVAITGAETVSTTLGVAGAIVHTSPQTISCGTGGTVTVASSPTSGLIVTSGTLASNCTIDFGTNATSGDFTLDMGGVTLGTSFGVIFKNGTSSSATFVSGSVLTTGDTLAKVWTHGANTLAVQY